MNGICYIISAFKADNIYIDSRETGFVIAADGGYENLRRHGIKADLVVGDFDSLGFVPEGENIVKHQPEKDDTDTMLAIREGLSRGYKKFIIYGGLGGRLDHTYANIQALVYLAENGAEGYLSDGSFTVTVLKNGKIEFDSSEKGVISVFCVGDRAEGVSIRGLKYTLENAVLKSDMPLGVSNEFLGEDSEIEVENGKLIVMYGTDIRKIADRM